MTRIQGRDTAPSAAEDARETGGGDRAPSSASSPKPRQAERRRLMWAAIPIAALLGVALVLRAPITVIPPLLAQVRSDLGLDAPGAGLLTAIPVLCFGLLTPFASRLLHKIGINHAVIYTLLAVIGGSLLRSAGSVGAAMAGTAVIGAGVAIGNLAVPMLIGRQFRHRSALLTGMYSATVNVAVTMSTALAVPVAVAVGWRRSAALGGVVLGAVGLVLWVAVYPPGVRGARPALRARAGLTEPVGLVRDGNGPLPRPDRPVTRWPLAWWLVVAFSGHTLSYYAVTAWLPSALVDLRGMTPVDAGVAASVFQAAGIVGPFLVPLLVGRLGWPQLQTVAVIAAGWAILPIGMLLAPGGWPAWALVGGFAQGAFFTALFAVVIERSRDVDENRRLSAFVQAVGYSVAATGPVLTGWVHQRVAGWSAPFALILVVVLVMGFAAVRAVGRDAAR
ncbi:MFS transporter [Actinotalea sp. M2MS4P-6]|uniref:MFS transporter n=1 Tax=Actinotalea sp. M2MS4P-6 TaxID=2983762 RepID=UPI0021E4F579|nr:MFS transporter [Actinotalea sp. M2MS4P-6]MCV2395405.1 MFS transporter [Actinotalea sp. M2MS4P-6]